MFTDWQLWCRFCCKYNARNKTIIEENLKIIVENLFSIALTKPAMSICTECHDFLRNLEKFGERCVQANKLFNELLILDESATIDEKYLKLLRCEYGFKEEKNISEINELKECTVQLEDIGTNSLLWDITKMRENEYRIENNDTCNEIKQDIEINIEETVLNSSNYHENNTDVFKSDPIHDSSSDIGNGSDGSNELIIEDSETSSKISNKEPLSNSITKCSQCDEEFDNKLSFYKHLQEKHTKCERNKPFGCSKCPKLFSTATILKIHERTHLPLEEKLTYPCEFCGRRFSQSANMRTHMRQIHLNDLPYICEECGKRYISKTALKEHQNTHSDERRFECPLCQKRFKHSTGLRRHKEVHSDILFVCSECGLHCKTKLTLKNHMVVHSDRKDFVCPHPNCNKEFKLRKIFKAHLLMHSGIKAYKCLFCSATYARNENRHDHQKKAHSEELAKFIASGRKLSPVILPSLLDLQGSKSREWKHTT